MVFKEAEFNAFVKMQAQIKLGRLPKDLICVSHASGTTKIEKGKYSSWTEYWKDIIREPIIPPKNVCPCCKRVIKEDKSNYFVIGHVEDSSSHRQYLLPLCNDCNVKMKKWPFFARKNKLHPIPTDL